MAGVIVTVTPNPALDVTYHVDRLRPGVEHRVRSVCERPGGKGVNVARVLASLGIETVATGLVYGEAGVAVQLAVRATDVREAFLHVDRSGAASRRTVVAVDDRGTATSLLEPGPAADPADADALLAHLATLLAAADVLVVSGSLPPGLPDDLAARATRLAKAAGATAVVDAGGPALLAAAEAGAVLKPNLHELRTALDRYDLEGHDRAARSEVVAAARQLQQRGAPAVVVTLGGHGAIAVHGDDAWWAAPVALPPKDVANTTGAGDAFAAGLARELAVTGSVVDTDWPRTLADATALAAAAVSSPVAGELDHSAYAMAVAGITIEEMDR